MRMVNTYHTGPKSPAHTSCYHYCLFSTEESEIIRLFCSGVFDSNSNQSLISARGSLFTELIIYRIFSNNQNKTKKPLLINNINFISPTIIETVGIFNSNVSLWVISIKDVFNVRNRTTFFWILSLSSYVSSIPQFCESFRFIPCALLYLHPNHWWNVE